MAYPWKFYLICLFIYSGTVNAQFTSIKYFGDSLLLNSLKTELGPSNSGLEKNSTFFYRPDTAGFYYRYFHFNKLIRTIDRDRWFDGFIIGSYKYGDEAGDFFDNNEELISIRCKVKSGMLGDIDLVGSSETVILEKFGNPNFEKEGFKIYTKTNELLIFSMDDKVNWYHYLKLNFVPDSIEDIPLKAFDNW